jgi:hypothetical protein
LSLGDVALNGIISSGFGSAPTRVLATQRRGLVVQVPLEPV